MVRWKQIIHRGRIFPYEVSDDGRVRRMAGRDCAGRMRQQKEIVGGNVGGYRQICLQVDRTKTYVCLLPDPPDDYGRGKDQVNHKNTNKSQNNFRNLEWSTPLGNRRHAVDNGLVPWGQNHPKAKLTAKQVIKIRRESSSGSSDIELGKKYGVTATSVYLIRKGKNWRHLKS